MEFGVPVMPQKPPSVPITPLGVVRRKSNVSPAPMHLMKSATESMITAMVSRMRASVAKADKAKPFPAGRAVNRNLSVRIAPG